MSDPLMDPLVSCLPCLHGEHQHCRHQPDGPRFSGPTPGEKCRCEEAKHVGGVGTCSDMRSSDWGSLVRCGRPAKGTAEIRPRFAESILKVAPKVTLERCGIHLAGLRRREENEAKWRAENAARDARWKAERENRQAASDWVERFAREFGIDAQAVGTAEQVMLAFDAERLYGRLKEAVIEMDAIGMEHSFHGDPDA